MNSKRLFVTKDDNFTLTVYFTTEGVLKAAREKDVPAEEKDKWEKFEIEFMLPDYGMAKGIMRNSIDNAGNLALGQFNNALLSLTAKKWNLTDDAGKEIPLDLQKLNELRPDITRLFVELLQEKITKEGLYDSILQS